MFNAENLTLLVCNFLGVFFEGLVQRGSHISRSKNGSHSRVELGTVKISDVLQEALLKLDSGKSLLLMELWLSASDGAVGAVALCF